jgi:hypothetical protein
MVMAFGSEEDNRGYPLSKGFPLRLYEDCSAGLECIILYSDVPVLKKGVKVVRADWTVLQDRLLLLWRPAPPSRRLKLSSTA